MEEEIKLPLVSSDIERLIPHRYPFIFVDQVFEFNPGKSIRALRNVSSSDPILQGHFPGNPILPGVVVLEGLAQTSAILGRMLRGETCGTCLLTEIEKTRFKRKVVPGDTLIYTVKLVKARGPFLWFQGEASVNDQLVASADFSAKLV